DRDGDVGECHRGPSGTPRGLHWTGAVDRRLRSRFRLMLLSFLHSAGSVLDDGDWLRPTNKVAHPFHFPRRHDAQARYQVPSETAGSSPRVAWRNPAVGCAPV